MLRKWAVLSLCATTIFSPLARAADEIAVIPPLAGGLGYALTISADGTTVGGAGLNGSSFVEPYRWTFDDGVQGLGDLGGSAVGVVTGISDDGSVIVGSSINGGGTYEAYRWTAANGMEGLGNLGGADSQAQSVSADGLVIAGNNSGGSITQAFRWTEGGGMVSLGHLGGNTSSTPQTTGINADGSVIVGTSNNGVIGEAFRWTQGGGMQGLGNLGGTTNAGSALDVNADGSVVVGQSGTASNQTHAFRWTQGGGMVNLNNIGANSSTANFVSDNGNIVVGSFVDNTNRKVYRWTQGTGMVAIASLGTQYTDVSAISADASVVVGEASDGGNAEAYRWTQADGAKYLRDILTDANIDLTGWDVIGGGGYMGISADGQVIVGAATYNGTLQSFIFGTPVSGGGGGGGIITPEELSEALASTAAAPLQLQAAVTNSVGQSMFVARNAVTGYFPDYGRRDLNRSMSADDLNDKTPSAGGPRLWSGHRKAFYVLGNYGIGQQNDFNNDSTSGTTGLLVEVADHLAVGAGVIGSTSRQETRLDGHNRTNALGGNVIVGYEPPSGMRLYGTATVARLDLESRRHYMNGSGIDSSKGDTQGIGYGAALRGGYEVGVTEKTSVMPYAEVQASHTSLDSYTETGGGFPALIDDQDGDLVTSHVGAEVSHDIGENTTIRGRGAWGHRYTDSDAIVATAVGITQAVAPYDGDRDWAEAGVTLNYNFTDKTTFTVDIAGRAGKTADPAASATIGLVVRW